MKKYIFGAFFLLGALYSKAQISGTITGQTTEKKELLFGVQIHLLHQQTGTASDVNGKFTLALPTTFPDTLIFNFIGYYSDTFVVQKPDAYELNVTLLSKSILDAVVISAHRKTSGILRMESLSVENLSSGELRKAACCNLSESFSTNASVDVSTTDAVSGARRIQLMGLDGVYTQIQAENMPIVKGLGSSFGVAFIPGTWVESIQITKGTGTVINGYEPMAGLVNVELKKPKETETFFVNGYGNIFGRAELNMHGATQVGKKEKWSTGWFAHGAGVFAEMDKNKDGFRDMPMSQTASLFNRWDYDGKKSEIQFGVRGVYDNRWGGQMGAYPSSNNGKYLVHIENKNLHAFLKTGFFFDKRPTASLGVIYQGKWSELNAQFGTHAFHGIEKRLYVNSIYADAIGNTNHGIKTGLSMVYLNFQQALDSTPLSRQAFVPGVFLEYTYTGAKVTVVLGAREDYHSLFGFQFSPRAHLKWSVAKNSDLRVSGGRGWRVPNYASDNISLLATGRTWVNNAVLKPEISWNTGGSWVQRMTLFKRAASITVDYFYTQFTQQLIIDRENPNLIQFHNLVGRSFSHAAQVEFAMEPLKFFEIRLAYKYLDVRAKYGGKMQEQVMVPKHRALLNMNYQTRNRRWKFDLTTVLIAEQRLPGSVLTNSPYKSSAYVTMNAQITSIYKKWEFYVGGENITNYRQKSPIIAANTPFGTTFDATQVWGPIFGINVYAGFRYSFTKKKTK